MKNPYIHKSKETSTSTTYAENFNPLKPSACNNANDPTQQWHGSPRPIQHEGQLFTIGFSNLNGISTESNRQLIDSLKDLTATLKHYNISILGLSEHHLALRNPGVAERIHKFEQQFRKQVKVKCFLHSSQETTPDNRRLMGGTGIIALDHTVGRIRPKGTGGDEMGRWTYVHLQRAEGRILTIITIYQVCQTPTNKLGGTAWHQQRRALDLLQRTTEHPREAFMFDLTRLVKQLIQQGHELIVGGDWNDHIMTPRSTLLKFSTTTGLVDPWLHFYPDHAEFATHERGSQRIDVVLVSSTLLQTIESISYSPVGILQNNDHRTIVLQMSSEKLFGRTQITLTRLQERNVRANDKASVTKYVEAMYDHLCANSTFTRSEALDDNNAGSSFLVENIDQLVGQASDHAENQCKRRRPEWFSVSLTNQRLTVSYLKHLLRGLAIQIDRRQVVTNKLKMIGFDINTLPNDEREIRELLKDHQQRLEEMKTKSRRLRTTELKESDSKPAQKIRKHEIALSTWKTIAFLKQTTHPATIDSLEIPYDWPEPFTELQTTTTLSNPKEAEIWRSITDPREIEYYLLLRNRLHFGQAHGSPFTVEPLATDIPWEADSSPTEDILNGTYIPSHQVSTLCKEVLYACQQRSDDTIIQATVSYESFRGKMRKWRESTVTSPSGRHLGRYKALFNKGIYTLQDEEYERFNTKQQEIAKLILRVMNYCIRTGHVLQRWLTVVNTMICKDPGVFKIHRLRVLHLYEADFNLIMGVKWRELIKESDQRRWVNDKQYGARPGCEASSLALYEEIRTDIAYVTRRMLASVDNDADSCFDRMVPSLISLNNRSFGLPLELARLHGKSLRNMRYHLRSTNGLSETFYSHTPTLPIYGTGQGSGNSPVLWLLMSATLFDVYDEYAYGTTIQDPSGAMDLKMTINGFVDDTNSCVNNWRPQSDGTLADLKEKVKHDAQLWADLVSISGGKLELSKCSVHYLTFDFDPDGTPQVNLDRQPSVELIDPLTQTGIGLKSLNSTQPHRTLGHWKAPAGNARKQLRTICDKVRVINLRIATSSVSRYGARLAYHAITVSTLRYVLPQCHFSKTILRRGEKTGLALLVAKCGFSSRTPHALLFATREYAGGGFVHWDVIQGEGQILLFLKHWRTDTALAAALQIDLAWCQWQSGISQSILVNTTRDLPYLEARWIPSVRASLAQFRARIHIERNFIIPPERTNEGYLMEIAQDNPQFTNHDIRIINYCRLYLHVTTVSEIFDSEGRNILPLMMKCQRPPWFDPSLNIVIQKRPSDYQIRKRWIPFCKYIATHHARLGGWIGISPLRLRRECYSLPESTEHIYYWYQGTYWKCSQPTGIGNHLTMKLVSPTEWTPSKTEFDRPYYTSARIHHTVYAPMVRAIPTTRTHLPKQITNDFTVQPRTRTLLTNPEFDEYVDNIPAYHRTFLQNIQWSTTPRHCAQQLQSLTNATPILIVTDGSSVEGVRMSFGGIIGTYAGDILARFHGPATGQPSSHRAEVTGVLAGSLIL